MLHLYAGGLHEVSSPRVFLSLGLVSPYIVWEQSNSQCPGDGTVSCKKRRMTHWTEAPHGPQKLLLFRSFLSRAVARSQQALQ